MRKILRLALLFVSLFLCSRAEAQNQATIIKGTVTDEKGVTLPGVSVAVKDSKVAVTTDLDGKYSITLPPNAKILSFSFIGAEKQEVVIGTRTIINVTLKSSTTALDAVDIVAIGYGSQKRQDINGAVSSVKASDIANLPQVSVDQMLQGKAAGVTITQSTGAPGSATSVHIRGVSNLSGTNEPLYVIDGIPMSGDANNGSTSGRTANQNQNNGENAVSPLALINPSDIASIDVLKDASATAIYGSRGSNGVIIITTKRGKNGSARINYDGYYGFQQQGKFLKMMNLQQYASLENQLADIYGVGRRGEFADPSLLGEGTNWQKGIFRTAPMQSHQVSVSGGKEGVDYYISGGYLKQEGTIIGSDFNRYSFRSNVNGQVKDWFKLGSAISFARTEENTLLSDNNGIVYNALLSAPDQAVRNPDGSFAGPLPNQVGGVINPVAQALTKTNNLVRNNLNANFYNDLRFSQDLSLRSELGGSFGFSNSRLFNPTYAFGTYVNPTATLSESWQQNLYWNWKEYLTYTHIFAKKHNLTALLGHEVTKTNWNGIGGSRQSFYSNDLQTLNLGDAKTAQNDEYKGSNALESAYARAIYTFDNKYSLTATFRADKSSNFAPGHQTGYFPSFAASWRVSDEAFMSRVKQMADNIKIRIGYGETGNQDIAGYQYGAALTPTSTGLGTGFLVDKIPNPNLKWQTSIQTNIGLDFSLFNRIDASFDWYKKTSKNFLFQKPLPAFLTGDANYLGGINPPFINGGRVDNTGFEFTINSKNIIAKNFNWSTTLVFSHYTTKVVSLADGTTPIIGQITNGFLQLSVTQTSVGGPIGEFYGYKVKGLFKTDDQLRNAPIQFGRPVANKTGTWLGDIQYVDVNNDGKIDASDLTRLGNPNPDFTFGITNNFNYKAVELSIFLQGSYGGKILNALNYTTNGLSALYQNQLASAANYWTPTNSSSNIPAPKGGDNPNLFMSDRFLENASYLRVQNVRLGYSLPTKWIKAVKLSRLKVYASGQNLFVITGYKGLDPEIGSMNQNVFLTNIDIGRYPSPRTITFGINAEF
ncbi:MAG: SusC/RagA family TonB-linked outer membrane protein [Mucilaginibacter sp.]|nr:SusC/RagA family TonB-linked outer membrane protein [Mucilaginibacter sp.]